MRASLSYRPVVPHAGKTLGDALKSVLREKYELDSVSHLLRESDIPYLEGLRDAGIKDAKELIDCIEQHKKVEIFLSY